LKSTEIINGKDLKSFGSILPEAKTIKLVYRGTKDGFAATTFHDKCADKANLLYLVRSS